MYCKVAHCRFSSSHVTKGHKCGQCGAYGHGEIECLQQWRKPYLENFEDDRMPNDLICSVEDCRHKFFHSTAAHHCGNCGRREAHTLVECPLHDSVDTPPSSFPNTVASSFPIASNSKEVKCPICRADSTMTNPKKILGLTDKCSICLDNNVEILLTTCYHCCVCKDCFDKM